MFALSQPTTLNQENVTVRTKIRDPWKLPDAKDKEEIKTYVWKVKDDAPFEYETIAGETVCKYKNPADHSLSKNSGKPKKTMIQTILLSESQAKALAKRMKDHEKLCFSEETRKLEVVNCADWIDLCLVEDYQKKVFGGEVKP